MRIAWSPTLGYADPASEVVGLCEQAVRTLEDLGCEVKVVDTVMERDPIDMWMSEFYAGVGTRLKTLFGDRQKLLDPAVAGMLARRARPDGRGILCPCVRTLPVQGGDAAVHGGVRSAGVAGPAGAAVDAGLDVPPGMPDANVISWVRYTYPFNLTGQPAASLPAGFTEEDLPVGLQLVAKTFREADIFRAAAALEAARPWNDRTPPMA